MSRQLPVFFPTQINRHRPVLHNSFKGKVISSHSHGFELTSQWIESQHLAHLPSTTSRSTTSKYCSNWSPSQAASASLNSLNHNLGVHLQVHYIMASRCNSKPTRSRTPSVSPNSLDSSIQVHTSIPHQQQPQFPSETGGCSGRLWWLWRYLVPSDGESDTTHRPSDGYYTMPCILARRCVVYCARRSGVTLPLLCIRNVVTFIHHQNDTYVTLFTGVAVMQ